MQLSSFNITFLRFNSQFLGTFTYSIVYFRPGGSSVNGRNLSWNSSWAILKALAISSFSICWTCLANSEYLWQTTPKQKPKINNNRVDMFETFSFKLTLPSNYYSHWLIHCFQRQRCSNFILCSAISILEVTVSQHGLDNHLK